MNKFKKEDIIESYKKALEYIAFGFRNGYSDEDLIEEYARIAKETLEKFDTKDSDEKIVLFENIQSKLQNEQTIKCILKSTNYRYSSSDGVDEATLCSIERDKQGNIISFEIEAFDGGFGKFYVKENKAYLGNNKFSDYPYDMTVTDWNITEE